MSSVRYYMSSACFLLDHQRCLMCTCECNEYVGKHRKPEDKP